ncbi:type-4 uracil-DNA glycosylase [Acidilobus saccharovorans]|uniref:type-4 uracil-DNA glycosylase n=1 Tax=Acidilobus saccharovorans TaxID=242703 RepID=UPI000AB11886|nr:type-4 uracil-DNA glycosylase [Acidilobus saccharovorans]
MSLDNKKASYDDIAERVRNCKACPLHRLRTNAVPGEGNLSAKIMLVGEAPGKNEDEQGRPFVGAAGQLLSSLLEQAGLRRQDVYITNVVKCRPPNNRTPTEDEVAACIGFLKEEISLVRPKVIVALGNTAGSALMSLAGKQWRGVTAERGRKVKVSIGGVELTVIPTYHPAAALYKPDLKDYLAKDIKEAAEEAEEPARARKTLLDFMGG